MKNKTGNILIVDDDQSTLDVLSSILGKSYNTFTAKNKGECYSVLDSELIDVIFLDILLAGDDGLEILEIIKKKIPEIEIIMMSVLKKTDTIVKAIKLGAVDFLSKDYHPDDVLFKANKAFKAKEYARNIKAAETERNITWHHSLLPIQNLEIGPIFEKFLNLLQKNNFLILCGEHGTGKKTIARAAHLNMGDSTPFIIFPTNVSESEKMINELFSSPMKHSPYEYSLIELANGGTLYIEEIDNVPETLQKRLYSLLQKGSYIKDGRVVRVKLKILASSNQDASALKNSDKIIPELLELARGKSISLPPLRKRKNDITAFSKHYLNYFCNQYRNEPIKFSKEAQTFLEQYLWIYNISELKNVIESVVITSSSQSLTPEDFHFKHLIYSPNIFESFRLNRINLRQRVKGFERDTIFKILSYFNWNKKKTANYLSIPYNTLKVKIRNYKIKKT